MARNLVLERITDDAAWDSFAMASPQYTPFVSSRWLKAAGEAHGADVVRYGVTKNGCLVAGLSCMALKRGPFMKATSPILTPYGGLLYRPDPGKRHSEAESFNIQCARLMLDEVESTYGGTMIVHAPALNDIRPFTWHGWRERVRYTYVLDIADPDALWNMLERRVRTVIRNAGASLSIGGLDDLDVFVDLYTRIYGDRNSRAPVSPDRVRLMVERVLGDGQGVLNAVRDGNGDVISSMILIPGGDTVYAWLSGSLPGENSSGAFSLLFWDAIKRFSPTHRFLDMVGANLETIAFFKKGFGGELTPYYVTDYYASLFNKCLFDGFAALKRLIH